MRRSFTRRKLRAPEACPSPRARMRDMRGGGIRETLADETRTHRDDERSGGRRVPWRPRRRGWCVGDGRGERLLCPYRSHGTEQKELLQKAGATPKSWIPARRGTPRRRAQLHPSLRNQAGAKGGQVGQLHEPQRAGRTDVAYPTEGRCGGSHASSSRLVRGPSAEQEVNIRWSKHQPRTRCARPCCNVPSCADGMDPAYLGSLTAHP